MFRRQKEFNAFKYFQRISGTRFVDSSAAKFFTFMAVLIVAYTALGTWCVQLCFGFFDKSVPFFGDLVMGFFLGEFAIPIAFILWVLQSINVI